MELGIPRRLNSKIIVVTAMLLALSLLGHVALGQERPLLSRDGNIVRLREMGTVSAKPDTVYLLMKVQSDSAELSQAIKENEQQLEGFTAALQGIEVERSSIQVKNFVVLPSITRTGVSFSRNLVICVEKIDTRPAEELNRLVAKIQDIGARFGSHCVTCIGSG